MSLLNQNNKKGKKKDGKSNSQAGGQGSKFITKPASKPGGFAQKPHKAGGTRGS